MQFNIELNTNLAEPLKLITQTGSVLSCTAVIYTAVQDTNSPGVLGNNDMTLVEHTLNGNETVTLHLKKRRINDTATVPCTITLPSSVNFELPALTKGVWQSQISIDSIYTRSFLIEVQ